MRKCALCSGSRQDPRRRWPSRTAGWAARCGSVAGLARVRPRRSGPAQSGTRPRAPVRARKLVCAPITFTCVVPLLQRLQGVPICATPGSPAPTSPAPVGTAIELAAASACAPSQGGSYKAAFLSNSVASSCATRLRSGTMWSADSRVTRATGPYMEMAVGVGALGTDTAKQWTLCSLSRGRIRHSAPRSARPVGSGVSPHLFSARRKGCSV
jgi:hypothetical protein